MERTPRLYDMLVHIFRQHQNWLDLRHLKTLAWMTVGLIQSGTVSLTAWAPDVHSRAVFAQSTVRRFARWLENERINGHALDGPLMQQALAEWGTDVLYRASDTSMLWDTYCLVRISLLYRGRAVPLVWTVLEHPSRSVASEVDQGVLEKVDELLPVLGGISAEIGFRRLHIGVAQPARDLARFPSLARSSWRICDATHMG